MPNQFKCNEAKGTSGITEKHRIDSFNAVYDIYLEKNNSNTLNSLFTAPTEDSWDSMNCLGGSCPGNTSDGVAQGVHYTTVDGINKVLNRDLAKYLDDCATKFTLGTNAPYYGSGSPANMRYPQTITLRDVSYNNLLDDRNDLDRKMKEVLALQGSMVNEHQNYVDGSVYTTLLWTVMATSLVYYVFTKI